MFAKNLKMKKIFFCLLLITCVSVVNAQDWIVHKLDEKITLKFPQEPAQTGPAWTATDKDSSSYIVSSFDLSQFGVDSAMIASQYSSEMFIDQFKGGLQQQMANLNITKFESSTWNGYPAYNIEGSLTDSNKSISFLCVFMGTECYNFVFSGMQGVDTSNKNLFFTGITVTP